MDVKQEFDEFNDFVNTFYGYGKLISAYSRAGSDLLTKINEKSEKFNELTENERIELMNSDPDFQNFQTVVSKLYSVYGKYLLFMDEGMKSSNNNQPTDDNKK